MPARPIRATIYLVDSAPLTAACAPRVKLSANVAPSFAASPQASAHGTRASINVLSPTTAPRPNER